MSVLQGLLAALSAFNSIVLAVGRQLGWVALGLMVVVILLQVVMRYVFNAALPWPDEAARFLMLWMTGLVAPSAYRWGGFVAIDMIPDMLSKRLASVLLLLLTLLATFILSTAIYYGWQHTFGFGGNFNSGSLRLPLDWFGGEQVKVKLRYMYGSFLLCMILLLMVNVELILRQLVTLLNPDAALPDDGSAKFLVESSAEGEAAGAGMRAD
ncbi:MAG: TRAP transporter small permease subunit [Pseudomonadota bacterium]